MSAVCPKSSEPYFVTFATNSPMVTEKSAPARMFGVRVVIMVVSARRMIDLAIAPVEA
jgi:hypothetical protein